MISIICAVAEKNRAIGKDNKLLWNLPTDLAHFKKLTSGHPIVMGQKTFESIGRPLPNRTNIIVTLDKEFSADGCQIFHSIPEAIEYAKNLDDEVFIIGGGSIYKQTIDLADRLYLTLVEGDFEADTFFPDFSNFKIISEEKEESGGYKYKYAILER
jgi:dihydrofolate reductase